MRLGHILDKIKEKRKERNSYYIIRIIDSDNNSIACPYRMKYLKEYKNGKIELCTDSLSAKRFNKAQVSPIFDAISNEMNIYRYKTEILKRIY